MAQARGERRNQILQTLAHMLEHPKAEKITTAALAKKLEVSEAALYRHFASKAQMFEGLIEFIEQTIFSLINKITQENQSGLKQTEAMVQMLLGFAQKNPGMTRVLLGDALVNEDERLLARVSQMLDRVEASLRQAIRVAQTGNELPTEIDTNAQANTLLCFVIGRWHQYARSGFTKAPAEMWAKQSPLLI